MNQPLAHAQLQAKMATRSPERTSSLALIRAADRGVLRVDTQQGTLDQVILSALSRSMDRVIQAARATGDATVVANAEALILTASQQARQDDDMSAAIYTPNAAQSATLDLARFGNQFGGFGPTERLPMAGTDEDDPPRDGVAAVTSVSASSLEDAPGHPRQFNRRSNLS